MSTALTTHVWHASSARRLVLDGFLPVPRGTVPAAPAPLVWPAKDPSDVLDYEFDISPALSGNEGDGIAGVTVSITPNAVGDLTLNSSAADGAVVVLWLAGGQAGTTYSVAITTTTQTGRIIGRAVLLPVQALAVAVVPASALTTEAGAVVTDQSGNPILLGS
jgi:hypothetical protein